MLLVTGDADSTRIDGEIPRSRLIKKPYRMAELASAIQDLLWRHDHRDTASTRCPGASPWGVAARVVQAVRALGGEPRPRGGALLKYGPPM